MFGKTTKRGTDKLQVGIIPSCWQLAQQINKKFHKPLTVQDTSIIRLLKTISIDKITFIVDTVLLWKNFAVKHLVNNKMDKTLVLFFKFLSIRNKNN